MIREKKIGSCYKYEDDTVHMWEEKTNSFTLLEEHDFSIFSKNVLVSNR